MDLTDVFGVQVHIGEAITGDMPQAGDGGGGIAGDRAASPLIGQKRRVESVRHGQVLPGCGPLRQPNLHSKQTSFAADIANLRDLLRRQ